MASIPDLTSLLCLDARYSSSLLGGQHRTILIQRDFSNTGDFALSSILQHFAKRDTKTPLLLVTLSHDWINYSASAAKCGVNLRRTQNMGSIDVVDVMAEVLNSTRADRPFQVCAFISDAITNFLNHSRNANESGETKPVVVMIDDLSMLIPIGSSPNDLYQLIARTDKLLRDRSKLLPESQLSHLVVQTMTTSSTVTTPSQSFNDDLSYLITNLENLCDIVLALKPLKTGHSTRVDGTIKIVDNRSPSSAQTSTSRPAPQLSLVGPSLTSSSHTDIGSKRAFFYKLGDRRVRLTSSALIF